MDFASLPVAAKVTSVVGLLGLLVYAVLKVTGQYASTLKLTPEIINALKNHGIDADAVKSMDKDNLSIYLKQQGDVSGQLVRTVLAAEVSHHGRIVLWVSLSCIGLAVLLASFDFVRKGPAGDDSDRKESAASPVTNESTVNGASIPQPSFLDKRVRDALVRAGIHARHQEIPTVERIVYETLDELSRVPNTPHTEYLSSQLRRCLVDARERIPAACTPQQEDK